MKRDSGLGTPSNHRTGEVWLQPNASPVCAGCLRHGFSPRDDLETAFKILVTSIQSAATVRKVRIDPNKGVGCADADVQHVVTDNSQPLQIPKLP